MARTQEEKVRWLDTCHECDRQNPLQKKKRCEVWYAIATNSPMCDIIMDKVESDLKVCSFYEPKVVK